jgi:chemotaxis signal transduction protein
MSRTAKTIRMLPCEVAGRAFSLRLEGVRSLHPCENLTPVDDGTPLVGRIRLRTGEIPVYALAELLGLGQRSLGRHAQVVIFESRVQPWGLLVESVRQAEALAIDKFLPLPAMLGEACAFFESVVCTADGIRLVLDPVRMDPEGGSHAAFSSAIQAQLQENAAAVLADLPMQAQRTPQLILFRTALFGNETRPYAFGLPMASILEVMELPEPLPVPGSPEFVRGVVAWRDAVVPLLDWSVRCGLPETPKIDRASRAIIARFHGELMAILCVGDVQILRLPARYVPSERDLGIDATAIHAMIELLDSTVLLPDGASLAV